MVPTPLPQSEGNSQEQLVLTHAFTHTHTVFCVSRGTVSNYRTLVVTTTGQSLATISLAEGMPLREQGADSQRLHKHNFYFKVLYY